MAAKVNNLRLEIVLEGGGAQHKESYELAHLQAG